MNSIVRPSLLLLFAVSGLNAAELPKKAPLSRYAELWTKSPFTTTPPPQSGAPEVNPFDDWALKGVAPIAGGYLITLLNKKNPAEAVPPIDTDKPSEFQVLSIERDPDNALGTVVYLQKGDMKGSVTFDPKLSVPKAPPKQGPKPPGVPKPPGPVVPAPQPVVPAQPPASRQPRSRVVPPPAAGGTQPGGAGNNSSRGGGRGGSSSSGGGGYTRPSGR